MPAGAAFGAARNAEASFRLMPSFDDALAPELIRRERASRRDATALRKPARRF